MIPDRAPTTIWCLRLPSDHFPNPDIYVRTGPNDHIVVAGPDEVGCFTTIHMSRKDARLLAKRINECLDSTVKR